MSKYFAEFADEDKVKLLSPIFGKIINILYFENGQRKVFDDSSILERIDLLEIVVKDNYGRVGSIYLHKSKIENPSSLCGQEAEIYADTFLYAIEF